VSNQERIQKELSVYEDERILFEPDDLEAYLEENPNLNLEEFLCSIEGNNDVINVSLAGYLIRECAFIWVIMESMHMNKKETQIAFLWDTKKTIHQIIFENAPKRS